MANVFLDISDAPLRITLDSMLRAAGHTIVETAFEVTIADSPAAALRATTFSQALLVCPASGIPEAIAVMKEGVFGYIFIPLQPGEACLMVERAAQPAKPVSSTITASDYSLAAVERAHILDVMRRCKYNQVKASRLLGIGRNTLWRKLKSYPLESQDAPNNAIE